MDGNNNSASDNSNNDQSNIDDNRPISNKTSDSQLVEEAELILAFSKSKKKALSPGKLRYRGFVDAESGNSRIKVRRKRF